MALLPDSIRLFAGNSIPHLAQSISESVDICLGQITVNRFSDGEIKIEILQTVRGLDVFFIQSTCNPANEHLMELLIAADALKRSSVNSITAVIPYMGYSRQDRRPGFSRTPITSSLVANMLQTAGVNQVITVDIHSEQQLGFFDIPVTNITAAPVIIRDISTQFSHSNLQQLVIVSPDAGGTPRARAIAKQFDARLAIIDKRRQGANQSEVMNVIGDVSDAHCIIVDDMIDTAGTLCKGAAALKQHGAKSVKAYATHPVLSGDAYANIENSCIDEVVVTNTIPLVQQCHKIRSINIGQLIGQSITRMCNNRSVSELYQ